MTTALYIVAMREPSVGAPAEIFHFTSLRKARYRDRTAAMSTVLADTRTPSPIRPSSYAAKGILARSRRAAIRAARATESNAVQEGRIRQSRQPYKKTETFPEIEALASKCAPQAMKAVVKIAATGKSDNVRVAS